MTDSTITAMPPAALPLENEAVPCVQNGSNVQAPAAAFGIPVMSTSAPTPLAEFQTWIQDHDGGPTLNMYIAGNWVPLYTFAPDGTLAMAMPLTLQADPAEDSQAATKHYVDTRPAATGTLVFKNTISCSGNPNYPAANQGDLYVVSAAGKIGGASGVAVEVGDTLLCLVNSTASGDQTTAGGNWVIGQGNIVDAVSGPTSAGDGNFVLFDGTSGLLVKDGGLVLDTDVTMAANSDARIPSQKAVKGQIGGRALSSDALTQGQGWIWDGVTSTFRARNFEGQNLLVNSAFDIWQENTSYTISTSVGKTHIADFWKAASGTAATRTVSQTSGIRGSMWCVKLARVAGSTDTDAYCLAQQFGARESQSLVGQTVTISFDVKAGANLPSPLALYAQMFWGKGANEDVFGNPSSPGFATSGGSVSSLDLSGQMVSGSVARVVSAPLTVSSDALITQVAMAISTGAYPSGTAGADDSLSIANVKLELGNVATPYIKPDAADELRRCQTRYSKTFALATAPVNGAGAGTGEHRAAAVLSGAHAQSLGTLRWTTMLSPPTVTLFNPYGGGASGQARDLTGNLDCSSTAAQNVVEGSCEIVTTGNASSAAGNTFGVHAVIDSRL
jgi:hypothetical protein